MKSRVKTALSLLISAVFIILAGCSNADSMMKVPGRYLLNGTLSEYTDANNFAYYINDDEAYVARGSSTSTTPEVPATVTLNGITYDVTGVYHGGFANSDITSITLPLSITTIDYQAFAGSALTSAVIPCNVEEMGSGAYMNCHSLTAVQFKNDESAGSSNLGVCGAGGSSSSQEATGSSHLTTVPDYCFFNDENLTTLSLPRSLTTVNTCAFQACTSLEKVAFLSNFTTLKKYAFESCTSLTDVYFPNSFTTASDDTSNCDPLAFYKAKSTCVLHLSSTDEDAYNTWSAATAWRSYNDSGFSLSLAARTAYDVGLGSDYLYRVENGEATVFSYAPSSFPASGVVVMPNSIDGYLVGKAEASTYSAYLSSLTQIYLSNNLKTISNGFFNNMTGLTTISSTGNGCYTPADNVIDLSGMSRLESVGTWLFTNSSGGNAATYLRDTFAGEVILPKSLKTIGEGAFANLKKATELSISATTPSQSLLETIGKKAFYSFGIDRASSWGDTSAFSFFELTLPATCTSIGQEAFSYFCGMKKIEFLGASGKSLAIGASAFYRCRSLCEIIFPKEDDTVTIGDKAFYECSAGDGKGFLDIAGIQEVYIPANVTSIGNRAFGCNERACFYFAAAAKPDGVNENFNWVTKDRVSTNPTKDETIMTGVNDCASIGYIEHSPVYYGVGYYDGSTSNKRRYIQTSDFGFVETGAETGEFICTRYRFRPKELADKAKITVTVPEYIKYKATQTNAFDGENGTSTDFKVVSLGDSAFSACYSRTNKKLNTVNVPHSIKRIGDNCFARSLYFYKLSSYKNSTTDEYNFPESLKYIGRTPFVLTRLHKALNIPGDVLAFDMIDPSVIATATNPVNFANIDKSTPRNYTPSEYQPRRFGCMFCNDWFLDEVTFTTVNDPNFSVDTTTGAIYRLNKIGSDGSLTPDIQLLMIMARLKNYNADSTANEGTAAAIDAQNITLGDTGYEFLTGMSSIRFGAFKLATWAYGLLLNTSVDLFPKEWGSDTPLTQNLLLGVCNYSRNSGGYCQIGGDNNEKDYWNNLHSLSFTGSGSNFALCPGIARMCTNLTSMGIPKNLTEIPRGAFDRAYYVSSWVTPNDSDVPTVGGQDGNTGTLDLRNNTNLVTIAESAFWGHHAITKIYFAPNVTTLGPKAWSNKGNAAGTLTYVDMSNNDKLTEIQFETFMNSPSLATVLLPQNITAIGESAFNSDQITSITWPANNTLTSIGKTAFYNNRIETLLLPDSVTTIGDSAFENGTATKILRLPTSLASISTNSFKNNSALNQVYVSNARTGLADNTVDMKKGTFGPNVKYAIMPNSAKFNSMPFKDCTGLKAVFYGRKYADTLSESTKNLAKYSGGTEDAALYYYTESASDMASQAGPLYWRYKPGSMTTVQVMEFPGYTVSAEYDFTTLLA